MQVTQEPCISVRLNPEELGRDYGANLTLRLSVAQALARILVDEALPGWELVPESSLELVSSAR